MSNESKLTLSPDWYRKTLARDIADMGMPTASDCITALADEVERLGGIVTDHAFEIVRLRSARDAWQTTALDNGADLDRQAGINLQLREEIVQLRDKRI